MERGRSDFVRLLGVGHTALDEGDHGEPLAFAVRRIEIDFRKPARIDDLLEVETRVKEMAGARIVLRQTVTRDGERLTEAEVTVVAGQPGGEGAADPESVRAMPAYRRRRRLTRSLTVTSIETPRVCGLAAHGPALVLTNLKARHRLRGRPPEGSEVRNGS